VTGGRARRGAAAGHLSGGARPAGREAAGARAARMLAALDHFDKRAD
jgi:hypothetical protein